MSCIRHDKRTIETTLSPSALHSDWATGAVSPTARGSSNHVVSIGTALRVATEVNPIRDAHPRNNVVSIGTALRKAKGAESDTRRASLKQRPPHQAHQIDHKRKRSLTISKAVVWRRLRTLQVTSIESSNTPSTVVCGPCMAADR